jgi:hypothetical protein
MQGSRAVHRDHPQLPIDGLRVEIPGQSESRVVHQNPHFSTAHLFQNFFYSLDGQSFFFFFLH